MERRKVSKLQFRNTCRDFLLTDAMNSGSDMRSLPFDYPVFRYVENQTFQFIRRWQLIWKTFLLLFMFYVTSVRNVVAVLCKTRTVISWAKLSLVLNYLQLNAINLWNIVFNISGSRVRYSMDRRKEQYWFQLHPTSGILTLVAPLDHERNKQVNNEIVFEYIVIH